MGIVFKRPNVTFSGDRPTLPKGALEAFCDASFASDSGFRSRIGYFFFFLGGLVSWSSTLTTRIMSSSTEAECHALVATGKENIWQREYISNLGLFAPGEPGVSPRNILPPTKVFQDNRAALLLSAGAPSHKRSKHFGLEFA